MIKKCADAVADWLISCDAAEETDKELYSYAVYSFLLSLSPLLLAMVFGAVTGYIIQSVMVVIPFVIMRKFSGGYHTKHSWSCLPWSCLLLCLCIVLSVHTKCGWGLVLVTAAAAVSLVYFSPIDNENRVLNQEEHNCYKKITAMLVVINLLLAVLLFFCQRPTYTVCISIGIILTAGLQVPCIFKGLIKKG